MQVDYEKPFRVLKNEKEIEVLINPFIFAYQNKAMEQLAGQIASAKIGMARLSSVIMNIAGNIISGQVAGDTSKTLAERFGKIIQVKESVSINRNDTSLSKSAQLDFATPASKIAALCSGEFVGMVADDPYQKTKLKSFHCEILNDESALQFEEKHFKELPQISMNELKHDFFEIVAKCKTGLSLIRNDLSM
jgi:hypothetical protein